MPEKIEAAVYNSIRDMSRAMEFWHKNRNFVLVLFAGLFLLVLCNRVLTTDTDSEKKEPAGTVVTEDSQYRPLSLEEIEKYKETKSRSNDNSFIRILVLAMALILFVKFGFKKGWFAYLMPQVVHFKASLRRSRKTGRLLMRISFFNNTPQSKTFNAPHVFFKKGAKIRNFVLRNEYFPLTLPSGSSHIMLIDVEQFWDKVAGLEHYKRVGASIETTTGERFRSLSLPRWLVIFKAE